MSVERRRPVGDRYVLQRMLADGAVLGGEQSGHIIFLRHNTTGDGLITALQLLAVMKRTGRSLAELARVMRRFPQSLVNVRTELKAQWSSDEAIAQAIAQAQERLAQEGRILVRASGTEPLVRVMVEAASEQVADEVAEGVAQVVRERLGQVRPSRVRHVRSTRPCYNETLRAGVAKAMKASVTRAAACPRVLRL